jgi:tetratricopeptide (TPR) repeat protein
LSFALNYYFAGTYDAYSFKLTNILIHCLNAALVFILCQLLFNRCRFFTQPNTNTRLIFWFASGVSLLWAVHPINLTSVLYVVQRMTSLSTFFSLGSIILYMRGRNRLIANGTNWRGVVFFIGSAISLTLAIFSKENAILIPLIILLIEVTLYTQSFPWMHFRQFNQKQRALIWVFLVTVGFFALLASIQYAEGGFQNRPFNMLERVLTESRVICFYIGLIFIPRINGFGLFHDDIALSTSLLSPWTTLPSILFIIVLIASAFYFRKKNPLYALGIGWFFIGHLLESTIFPLEIAHEHRNNLPSIGLILTAISLIPHAAINNKKLIAGFLLVALILGSTTWLRAKQWGNYQSLAYFEASHHPNSPAIQALLSNAANQAGDIEVATNAIKKAMELDSDETAYAMHYQNILAIHNKPIPDELQQETIRRIKANRLTPTTQLALDQIAGCLKKEPCAPLKNNYLKWIDAVINKEPNNALYYYYRGKAKRSLNKDLPALNDFQRAHEISTEFLHPLFEMADILLQAGQVSQAEEVIGWIENANEKTTFRRDKEIEQLKQLINTIKSNHTRSE